MRVDGNLGKIYNAKHNGLPVAAVVKIKGGEMREILKNLVKACPTNLTCDDFSHNKKGDLHGSEEDCPPCCRYYKALFEASEILIEVPK